MKNYQISEEQRGQIVKALNQIVVPIEIGFVLTQVSQILSNLKEVGEHYGGENPLVGTLNACASSS